MQLNLGSLELYAHRLRPTWFLRIGLNKMKDFRQLSEMKDFRQQNEMRDFCQPNEMRDFCQLIMTR